MGKEFDKQIIDEIKNTYSWKDYKESDIDTVFLRYSTGTHPEMEGEHGYWQGCEENDRGAFPVWWVDFTNSGA